MNGEINKLVDEIIKQDSLPGRNSALTDETIQELREKTSVEDVEAAALLAGVNETYINDALEALGLSDVEAGSDDITALFGFGDDEIIGGLPSDYIPREPTARRSVQNIC